jgi:hypothetical protein
MPRTGWVKPATDHRLSDHMSWGLLTRVFPPELVDQAVADSGRLQQRTRLLPARLVVYYVMGLALFSQSSYEEVMDSLVEGQSWASGAPQDWAVPTKAALFKARTRLGPDPLEQLFQRVARPLATAEEPGAFYGPWRLMSLDSADLDVPDTAANLQAFGRPKAQRDARPLPQVRVVGLSATGTRSIVDARLGGVRETVQALVAEVLDDLPADGLVLAGRDFFSPTAWARAAATGAQLLWRVGPEVRLPVEARHADGSYASHIGPESPARVIEIQRGEPGEGAASYRLVTTLVDPAPAPCEELGELYAQRWEIASAFDELKSHHLSPRVVMRSKMPDGVRQEVFGYLCVHYAVRWLMHGVQGISLGVSTGPPAPK